MWGKVVWLEAEVWLAEVAGIAPVAVHAGVPEQVGEEGKHHRFDCLTALPCQGQVPPAAHQGACEGVLDAGLLLH